MENNLENLRKQIDSIDSKILELLDSRLELVKQIGVTKIQNKSAIYRPEREVEILERLNNLKPKNLDMNAISAIYQEIFAISRNLELPERISYLGPIGSYTHQAAESKFGALSEYQAANTISAVFLALESKRAKYGVVPIENNTNGVVGETIDNLANLDLKIIAEIILPIHHSFASLSENLSEIKKIYSKDIAFGQCDNFLKANNLINIEQVFTESTAKAAKLASNDKHSAVICSKIAAKLYNLPIMFENIEDSFNNKTRFVVVSDFSVQKSKFSKTSAFAESSEFNKPGTLLELLSDFKNENINLLKLDSRPVARNGDFSFGFFLEFDGHILDENVKRIFDKQKSLKWLGSYPKSID